MSPKAITCPAAIPGVSRKAARPAPFGTPDGAISMKGPPDPITPAW